MAEPNEPTPQTPATPTSPPPTTAVTATPPASPKPPPAAPPKPPVAKPTAKGADRRTFITWIGVAWAGLIASTVGLTLGTLRFLFPNVLSEPPSTFRAGQSSSFEDNHVDDKFKDVGAWVIKAKDERGRDIIYALSTTCTHLGCTPNWLEAEKKFKCPCHGSGFKMSGVNFEGPAPRPLERYAIRRTDDGEIVVDKSRKFQRELGQWDDPDSYVLV